MATSAVTPKLTTFDLDDAIEEHNQKQQQQKKHQKKQMLSTKPMSILSDASNKPKQKDGDSTQSKVDTKTKRNKSKSKNNKNKDKKNSKNISSKKSRNNHHINDYYGNATGKHPSNYGFWNQNHYDTTIKNSSSNIDNFVSNNYYQNWNHDDIKINNGVVEGQYAHSNMGGGIVEENIEAMMAANSNNYSSNLPGLQQPYFSPEGWAAENHAYSIDGQQDDNVLAGNFRNKVNISSSSNGFSSLPSSTDQYISWMDEIDSNTRIEGIVCRNSNEGKSKIITVTSIVGTSILQQLMTIQNEGNFERSLAPAQQQKGSEEGETEQERLLNENSSRDNEGSGSGDNDNTNMKLLQSRSVATLNHHAPPFIHIHGQPPAMIRPPLPSQMLRGGVPGYQPYPHDHMMPHTPGTQQVANRPPPPGFMVMPPQLSAGMMYQPHDGNSCEMQPQIHLMHANPPQGHGIMVPPGIQQYRQQMMMSPAPIPFGRVIVGNLADGAGGGPGEIAANDDNHFDHRQHHHRQQQNNNNAMTPHRDDPVNPRRVSYSPFVPVVATPDDNNNGSN